MLDPNHLTIAHAITGRELMAGVSMLFSLVAALLDRAETAMTLVALAIGFVSMLAAVHQELWRYPWFRRWISGKGK